MSVLKMPVILLMIILIVVAIIIILIIVVLVIIVVIGALRLFAFQQNFSCGPQRLHANYLVLPGWPHSLEAEMFGLWGGVQSVPSKFLLSLKCPNPALKLTLQG